MDFKFKYGNPPDHIIPKSKWHPIYLELQKRKHGQWLGVEIPASRFGNALSAIRQYLRLNGMGVEMKCDKTNIQSGTGTIWFRKTAIKPTKAETEPKPDRVSIMGKEMKVVSVTDANFTGEGVEPLRIVEVVAA